MFFLVLSLFVQAAAVAQTAIVHTFDADKIGAPPPGFVTAAGREARADGWVVRQEGGGRVLAHTASAAPPDGFSVAVYAGAQYQDVEASVRVKAAGGSRTAGLVWKYQDAMNHYAVQLDLAKQELAVYRVVSGNRIRIEREDDLELDPDAWHSLRIVQDEGMIRLYLGGIRVFSERDRSARAPGSIGLWTAGDTTSLFDDLRIEPEHREPKQP